ncbi:MAG TPA: efflux transporter outer membrane subunit [Acidisarcina sp.]
MARSLGKLVRNAQREVPPGASAGGIRANRCGRLATALFAGLALLAGCTAGPNYHRPAAPVPPAYKENAGLPDDSVWKTAQPSDAVLRGQWWKMYGDPQLDALEDKVAVSNQTLQAASERYLGAREQIRIARADFYPTIGLGPSASRSQLSLNRAQVSTLTKTLFNDVSLEGQATWEPDFWGRVRRNVESARATTQASASDLANAELSIRTELALDYLQLRGLDVQKQLLDQTIISFQKAYELTQTRFHGGVSSESDVAQAETLLESTRAQDTEIDVARSQFEHAIATLAGEPASTFSLPPAVPPMQLPGVPLGVPSQLLERRPDISASERRMQAANAQIGVAKSAYYPNVAIDAAGGFESSALGTLIQGPAALWSLGGSAVETVFDAGRRRAVTEQAQHTYNATVADYRETVLGAFQEVEDNLAAIRTLQAEAGSQHAAVAAAQRSLDLSINRYKGGVATYLEVLTAQSALLANQRTDAGIATRQFTSSVQLIRALGGGWDTSQLPKF